MGEIRSEQILLYFCAFRYYVRLNRQPNGVGYDQSCFPVPRIDAIFLDRYYSRAQPNINLRYLDWSSVYRSSHHFKFRCWSNQRTIQQKDGHVTCSYSMVCYYTHNWICNGSLPGSSNENCSRIHDWVFRTPSYQPYRRLLPCKSINNRYGIVCAC